MARGTILSENLTQRQIDFMLALEGYEIDIFAIEELKEKLSGEFQNINELVENLAHKGILVRLEKGKYCRSNFKDENVIGSFLAPGGAVAYWSALNKHGLTEQFPNVLFVQSVNRKHDKTILGISFKFVQVRKEKYTGIVTQGYGNRQFRMTDVEKTIADCFDLPEYSGGYAELIRAFAQAKLSSEKMILYCDALNNIAIIKRMGYLAELLEKKGLKAFISYARQKVNKRYNLFDPFSNEKGEFVNDWRLRLNISREEILDVCNKQY